MVFIQPQIMNTISSNQPTWLDDLMSARDVSPKDREGYVFVLTWFEKWRQAKQVACSMKSTHQFWIDQVCAKKRHAWQLTHNKPTQTIRKLQARTTVGCPALF